MSGTGKKPWRISQTVWATSLCVGTRTCCLKVWATSPWTTLHLDHHRHGDTQEGGIPQSRQTPRSVIPQLRRTQEEEELEEEVEEEKEEEEEDMESMNDVEVPDSVFRASSLVEPCV